MEKLSDQLKDQLLASLWDRLRFGLNDRIEARYEGQVVALLFDQLQEGLWIQLRELAYGEARTQVKLHFWSGKWNS